MIGWYLPFGGGSMGVVRIILTFFVAQVVSSELFARFVMARQLDRPLRVRCMTYNTNRGKADENLFELVFGKDSAQLADIYVIGFQEIAGLHLTFPSWTGFAIHNRHQSMLWALSNAARSILSSQNSPSDDQETDSKQPRYNLLASPAHGGLGLLVYAREDTVHVSNLQTSSASCGFLNLMNNKGAVGVRLSLQRSQNDLNGNISTQNMREESLTFINAHLTAHDSGVLARNRDCQTILNRLVFQAPLGYHTIYDTNHLFFMGDLNYRISLSRLTNVDSKPITKQDLEDIIREERHSSLLPDHETLLHQHSCQNVLVGLKEATIKFKPTYKYKRGIPNEFVSFDHRLPGWTDRIFYASSADLQGPNVIEYQSVQEYHSSDHKPVFLVIDLPRYDESKRGDHPEFLTNRPRITIDRRRGEKKIVGFLLDQACGAVLLSAAFVGFGNITLGFLNITVIIGFLWKFYLRSS